MSINVEETIQKIDQLVLIPIQAQNPEVLQVLKDKRKQWADIFFDQTKSKEEKMAIQDNLAKLHKYFGYKEIRKIGEKGKGGTPFIATPEMRAKNCDAFAEYIRAAGEKRGGALPLELILALAHVWGTVK